MKNRKDIQDELNDIAPFLSQLEKQNSFQIPPGYFDEMQREVLTKVSRATQSEKQKESSWWGDLVRQLIVSWQPRLSMGLAAVLLIIGVLAYYANNTFTGQEVSFAHVSTFELQQFLSENLDEIDDELLMELDPEISELSLPESLKYNSEETEIILNEIIEDFDDDALEELL